MQGPGATAAYGGKAAGRLTTYHALYRDIGTASRAEASVRQCSRISCYPQNLWYPIQLDNGLGRYRTGPFELMSGSMAIL